MTALLALLAGYVAVPFPGINATHPQAPLFAAVRELVGDQRATLADVVISRLDYNALVAAATEYLIGHPDDEDAQLYLDALEDDLSRPFVIRDDVAPGFLHVPQAVVDRVREAQAYTAKLAQVKAEREQAKADKQAAREAAAARDAELLDPDASPLAWVEELQAHVPRARDRRSWDISNPLTKTAATGALVHAGLSVKRAQSTIDEWALVYAKYIDCAPGQPSLFEDADRNRVLNSYVQPSIVPTKGEWPVVSEVIDFLTDGDATSRRWLVNWMANAARNPGKSMRTAPVVYGAQKTGKSLLARVLSTIIGEANSANIRNDDIRGRFNAHYVAKLLVTVGEIDASEHERSKAILKTLTGEPTLMAEAKGVSAWQVKNRLKVFVTSNKTLPVEVEGDADTRWCLLYQPKPATPDYLDRCQTLFSTDTNEYSPAGQVEVAAFAHHLLHEVELDVKLAGSVLKGTARDRAVAASGNSVAQFVAAVRESSLDEVFQASTSEFDRSQSCFADLDIRYIHNEKGVEVTELVTGKDALFAVYRAYCKGAGFQPFGAGRFPGELERVASDWQERSQRAGALPRLWNPGAERLPTCYTGVPRDMAARSRGRGAPTRIEPEVEGDPLKELEEQLTLKATQSAAGSAS